MATPTQSKTYQHQENLPRLPVPPLVATCHKYLKTVQPFLGHQEFEKTKVIVEDFIKPGGLGGQLHQLLQERAKNSKTHWLQEWWDHEMYFAPRIPIAFNVNYYYHFDIYPPNQLSQTRRAANIISGALHFKKLLEDEELEPDLNRGQPMDMSAYEWMFSTCRIPRTGADYLQKYSPLESRHIVVMRKNNFYSFDVIHEDEILSTADIEAQLQKVKEMADEEAADPAIGLLTAEDRDEWAALRTKLLNIDAAAKFRHNTEALHKIQSAIFVVCLDDSAPTSLDEIARALWHGDGKNRWFDKSIQFIVFENGVCGLNGEHSKLDGLPVARLSDHILFRYKETPSKSNPYLTAPLKISFKFNEEIIEAIHRSAQRFNKLVNSFQMCILNFDKYGKQSITKKYGISPDAWCQLAMLYAYYKQIGRIDACYESASTKKFYHGRTETGRSVTMQAVDWIKAMNSSHVKDKQHLLKKATKAHTEYMRDAAEGLGVDRLLLGLYFIAKEHSLPIHDIFKDRAFTKSKHWNLSTSQMNSRGFHVGYGPVEEDGFGVCYCIRDHSLWFSIASYTTRPNMDSKKYHKCLSQALEEMQLLCDTKIQAAL